MKTKCGTPRCTLLIPAEVKCEYAGVTQGEYYTDLEKTIEASERYRAPFEEATGFLPPLTYPTPTTAYEGVAALGGELLFSRDHQPMLMNLGKVLKTPQEVDTLQVPKPDSVERFRRLAAWHRELKDRFGEKASPGIAGQEGPITTAVLLRGDEFFVDCLTDPKRAHRLLEVCTETFIVWMRRSMEIDGIRARIASVCDDHAGLLSPELWDEFVVPYYRRIVDAIGPEGFSIHTELVNRHHLPHLRSLPLIGVNFSEDQFLSIDDVFETLPGVPFAWHILTVSEMLQGTPDLIRRRCREIHASGVTDIYCELTVGTPKKNIRAFLEMDSTLG